MKNFQYKLTFSHLYTSVPNSGYTDTTDWTNPTAGLAEGYENIGGGTSTIINTNPGYTGNAQGFEKDSTALQGIRTNINLSCASGIKTTLKIKYTSNIDWNVYVNNNLIGILPDSSSLTSYTEITFTPDINNITRLTISEATSATATLIIDELRFQFFETAELTLTKNPIGWNDLGITFERNKTYHSVLRTFSLSLRFVKKPGGGGTEIDTAYKLDGISSDVAIEISERNPQTNDYDSFYTGVLDFNPQRFSNYRDWVESGVIDSSKLQKFKSRDEINFDLNSVISADNVTIDSFVSSPKDIIFQPINIILHVDQSGLFTTLVAKANPNQPPDTSIFWTDGAFGDLEPKDIYYYADDVTLNEIGDQLQTENGPLDTERTAEIFVNGTSSIARIIFNDVTINQNNNRLEFDPEQATNYMKINIDVLVEIYNKDDVLVYDELIFHHDDYRENILVNEEAYFNINLDLLLTGTYDVPAEGSFVLRTVGYPEVDTWSNATIFYEQNLENNLSFIARYLSIGQTPVSCFFPFEAFTRLVQLMTSETDTLKLFNSTYLGRTQSEFVQYEYTGEGGYDAITTGWNIRAFPDRAFNVNMKDLFTTFDNMHGLGLGYNHTSDLFYIETIDQFYDSGYLMFDLGEVDDLVIKPYREAFDSKVNSGYNEKGEYEDFQGVNEYNLQNEHSMSLPVKATKAARANYNLDSIGMELYRRFQYSRYASRDTKGDEKIYIVLTNGTHTIQGGGSISGWDGIEEYYNLKYTPRENLIRNAGWYNAALWNHEKRVKFIKAVKDRDISYTNQNGDSVYEFDDLTASDLLKEALFQPEMYELEGIFSPAILAILNTNPHGYIRFTFDNTTFEGFLLTVESGYYNRKANWKLIAKVPVTGDNYIFEDEDNYVFENEDNYVF